MSLTPALKKVNIVIIVCRPQRVIRTSTCSLRQSQKSRLCSWLPPSASILSSLTFDNCRQEALKIHDVGVEISSGARSRRHLRRNATGWPNAVLMLGQRRRRWPNIKSTLDYRLEFAVTLFSLREQSIWQMGLMFVLLWAIMTDVCGGCWI